MPIPLPSAFFKPLSTRQKRRICARPAFRLTLAQMKTSRRLWQCFSQATLTGSLTENGYSQVRKAAGYPSLNSGECDSGNSYEQKQQLAASASERLREVWLGDCWLQIDYCLLFSTAPLSNCVNVPTKRALTRHEEDHHPSGEMAKKLLQTTGMSFKLSAQSSPCSAQSSPCSAQSSP